jgi:hypothetical protein
MTTDSSTVAYVFPSLCSFSQIFIRLIFCAPLKLPKSNSFPNSTSSAAKMGTSFPSIQSFYQREVIQGTVAESSESHAGDGFTSSEVSAALHPLSSPWVPSREYEKSDILLLQAGPRNYEIMGRIVNFATAGRRGQSEVSPEGQRLLVVSDGTGAIAVSDVVCF